MNLISFFLFLPSFLVGYYRLSVFFVFFTSPAFILIISFPSACFFNLFTRRIVVEVHTIDNIPNKNRRFQMCEYRQGFC